MAQSKRTMLGELSNGCSAHYIQLEPRLVKNRLSARLGVAILFWLQLQSQRRAMLWGAVTCGGAPFKGSPRTRNRTPN